MVAAHLLPLYLGESVFPGGFSVMSSPVLPCALIPQGLPPWGVVVQGISEGFSLFARCPLGPFLIVELLHPLLLFLGGGERKTLLFIYYYAQL